MLENEEVIEKALQKYSEYVEVINIDAKNRFKRNWPHIDKAGGFFVARLKKIKSLGEDKQIQMIEKQGVEKLKSKEISFLADELKKIYDYDISGKHLYKYLSEVYMCDKNLDRIYDILFFYQIGIKI